MVLYRQTWIVASFGLFSPEELVDWGDAEYRYVPAFGIWSNTLLMIRFRNEYQYDPEMN